MNNLLRSRISEDFFEMPNYLVFYAANKKVEYIPNMTNSEGIQCNLSILCYINTFGVVLKVLKINVNPSLNEYVYSIQIFYATENSFLIVAIHTRFVSNR